MNWRELNIRRLNQLVKLSCKTPINMGNTRLHRLPEDKHADAANNLMSNTSTQLSNQLSKSSQSSFYQHTAKFSSNCKNINMRIFLKPALVSEPLKSYSRFSFILTPVQRAIRSLMIALPLWCATASLGHAQSWMVNLQDADVKEFISEVSTITNKNFIIDPRVNGKVTVISHRSMDEDEIYQLFLSVMQVNGIAALEKNGVIELRPSNIAKQSGIPVDLEGTTTGEGLATRVIYLNNTQASEMLSVLRPMIPQSAHAAAIPSANALILLDRADSLNNLAAVIRSLDSNLNETMETISLRHTDAERMMELIGSVTKPTAGNQPQVGNRFNITADPNADRLIVTGSPEQINRVRMIVDKLDTISSSRLSGMKVFKLKYSDSNHIADILRALYSGDSINSSGIKSTLESASLTNAGKGANTKQTANTNTNASASSGSLSDGQGRKISIISDETQNAIIANAPNDVLLRIESAIKELDKERPQVLIQAAIVEISGDDMKQLGVQWALGNANTGYGVVNFNNTGVSATTLASAVASKSATAVGGAAKSIAGALLGIGNAKKDNDGNTQFYGAILQALKQTTSANLLSMPSVMTIDREKASILVGQNVPFVTGSYTNSSGSAANPFQTIDRKDVGINLVVIPYVGDDNSVRLEVSQEVSAVVPSASTSFGGLVTNKSLITTTVNAKNQQTVALGGLMRDNATNSQQNVPGLSRLPMVGRLFRSDDTSRQKSNLIIFLQPTILRNSAAVASVTERKANQSRTMQLVIDPNGSIRQVPLVSSNPKWKGPIDPNAKVMSLNPFSSSHFVQDVSSQPQHKAKNDTNTNTNANSKKLEPTHIKQVDDTPAPSSKLLQPTNNANDVDVDVDVDVENHNEENTEYQEETLEEYQEENIEEHNEESNEEKSDVHSNSVNVQPLTMHRTLTKKSISHANQTVHMLSKDDLAMPTAHQANTSNIQTNDVILDDEVLQQATDHSIQDDRIEGIFLH